MNFLVETKNEYTIQLINILSPHIYEGFESIYSESKKIIKKGEEKKLLKAFQQFIKRIPDWNTNLIENETIRIRTASRCDFLHNLLKAVIKANIILLSNSNNITNSKSIIEKKYFDIPLNKFIHRCYVECARQFYNSPYLFYHDMRPIERKRNQRDCYDIIKGSIKEAIRKILPVQHILNKYLGDNLKFGVDEIDKPISAIESENLKEMISKDLNNVSVENKISNEEVIPTKLIDKFSINTIKNDIPYENTSDDETINLLSEIKKNILNFDQSDKIESNKININNIDQPIEIVGGNNLDVRNSDENISIPITNYYSENNVRIKNELKMNEEKLENNVLDSESSMLQIGNDDDYEDVFSNINDSNILELGKKNLDNKTINKKLKDSYILKLNSL